MPPIRRDIDIPSGKITVSGLAPSAPYSWADGYKSAPLTGAPNLIFHISTSPNPPAAEISEWSKPANYTSSLALVVSVGVVIYTYRKDSRARKHSVEDDYWLRKVVGPIAIEPLLKEILEMVSAAPSDAGSAHFSSSAVDEYHTLYLAKLSALAVQSASLQIIDKQLAAGTAIAIDQIQDLMIDYCHQNKAMHATGIIVPGHEKTKFQGAAKEQLVELLKPIRDYHVKKVGASASWKQQVFATVTRWLSRP